MKPILCRVVSCENGVLILEDIESKEIIKEYTKKQYEPKTILVLVNKEILPYGYKTKKILKEYREQKEFEKLIEDSPRSNEYEQRVKEIGLYEFYDEILTTNVDEVLKVKLLKHTTKKYKVIFKLDIPLYQEECLNKLNTLVHSYSDNIEYIGGEDFCIMSNYNTLNEKPYYKFIKNYQQISEINIDSVRIIL
jgi:hypothetical protein